jgi:hypothetical protein
LLIPTTPALAQSLSAGIDYKGLTTDQAKLRAVYSLIEQMRLEHNRQGALARSDWGKYKDSWYTYSKVFMNKLTPLLIEENRLRDNIRTAQYSSEKWKALQDRNRWAAELAMYGNQMELGKLSTKATTPRIAELESIDLSTLTPDKFVDPVEDFTTYIEHDPDNCFTVTAPKVDINGQVENLGSYVYKDYGAGSFGNFTHLSTVNATSASDWAVIFFDTLSNEIAAQNNMSNYLGLLFYKDYPTTLWLKLEQNAGGSKTSDGYAASFNTTYYLTFQRSGTLATLKIYSDSARTTLLTTLSLSVNTTTYKYVYAILGQAMGYSATFAGYIQDLDLQLPVPTVTNSAATDITTTGATLHGEITNTGGVNATVRGFEWDTDTGAPYANDWHENGDYGTGTFSHTFTNMPPNTTIYWRAYATNTVGTGYSGELNFNTLLPLPGAPTNFTITQTGTNDITITWTTGDYADTTVIRAKEDGYPTSLTDGYEIYNGALETVDVSGLNLGTSSYYYTAWSHNATGYSTDTAKNNVGGKSMVFFGFLAFAGIISFLSFRNRFFGLKLLAGMAWILLFLYTKSNPPAGVIEGSSIHTAMLVIFIGIGLMIPIMGLGRGIQTSRSSSGSYTETTEGFHLGIPDWMKGEEAQETSRKAKKAEDLESYRARMHRALNPHEEERRR